MMKPELNSPNDSSQLLRYQQAGDNRAALGT